MTPGLFLTLEGGDGVGKSTHAAHLVRWLRGEGYEVVQTREPGGTELGKQLREILLHSSQPLGDRAEALIFAADRAHHIRSLVRPALERGAIVVQDRYLDSSVVYQGAGRGLGTDTIRDLSLWAAEGLLPDLTILLDLSPEAAMARMYEARAQLDRLESAGTAFHERVRSEFLRLAAEQPQRFRVVDVDAPEQQVAEQIRAEVLRALATREQA